jgi:hypothetical protein
MIVNDGLGLAGRGVGDALDQLQPVLLEVLGRDRPACLI